MSREMFLSSIFILFVLCSAPLTIHASEAVSLEAQVQQLLEITQQQGEQIKQLQAELEALKNPQPHNESNDAAIQSNKETERVTDTEENSLLEPIKTPSIHGDFRYRYEYIDAEGKHSRGRNRIRARIGTTINISESLETGFMLASGDDDCPVSTNQTLGDAFSSKYIWLDLAYLDWHPAGYPGLSIVGGKMKNPLYTPGKSELLWDHDLRPEGISLHYQIPEKDLAPFLTLGGFAIEERKSDSDAYLYALQLGADYQARENIALTGGASLFVMDAIQGKPALYEDMFYGNSSLLSDPSDPFSQRIYAEDFTELEGFAVLDMKVHAIPVSVFGNVVHNAEVEDNNDAWLAGFSVGQTTQPGQWKFRYNYRQVEQDALLGVFTDSDFIGGGTDGKGHELCVQYQLFPSTTLGVTYLNAETDLSGAEKNYERLQLDVLSKF